MIRPRLIAVSLVGAGLLVLSILVPTHPALGTPISTVRADVKRLANDDANIINIVRSYAKTGPWKEMFNSAFGMETGDLFTLENDLHLNLADQPILASTPAATTAGEMSKLSAVELKLLSVLRSFAPTPAWKVKFNLAIAGQSAVMAYINKDLAVGGEIVKPFYVTFQDEAGTSYSVTPTGVLDPVDPVLGTVEAGYRLVAVKFEIADLSSTATVSVDANTAASLGTFSSVSTWSPNPVRQCTNFQTGEVNVSPRASVRGCVAFAIQQYADVGGIGWIGSSYEWPVL
jgi:hypothetical protein